MTNKAASSYIKTIHNIYCVLLPTNSSMWYCLRSMWYCLPTLCLLSAYCLPAYCLSAYCLSAYCLPTLPTVCLLCLVGWGGVGWGDCRVGWGGGSVAVATRHLHLPSPSVSCLSSPSPPVISARRRHPPAFSACFRHPPFSAVESAHNVTPEDGRWA